MTEETAIAQCKPQINNAPRRCCFRQSDASPSDPLVILVFSSSDTSPTFVPLRFVFFVCLVFAGVEVTTGLTSDGNSVGRDERIIVMIVITITINTTITIVIVIAIMTIILSSSPPQPPPRSPSS